MISTKRQKSLFILFLRKQVILAYVAFLGLCQLATGISQTIEIHGRYETTRLTPLSHRPITNSQLQVEFTVVLSSNNWSICATNLKSPSIWQKLTFDGTNMYALCLYSEVFAKPPSQSNLVFASVSRTAQYTPAVDDSLELYIPWLAYCLSPQTVPANKDGIIGLPLPWYVARISQIAYGYKWIMHSQESGSFLKDLEVVRDRSLDLPTDEEELLRPTFDYPVSLRDKQHDLQVVQIRRKIPDGFIEARYNCKNWYVTNQFSIPQSAEFEYFEERFPDHPMFQARLTATEIILGANGDEAKPKPEAATLVYDYRFRKANGKRLYRFAEYTLQNGQSWKAENDPEIVKAVEHHLRYGPSYDDFGKTKKIVVWLFLAALGSVPPLVILRKQLKQNRKAN